MSENTIPPVVAVQPGDGWYALENLVPEMTATPVEYFTVHADGSRRGWVPEEAGGWIPVDLGEESHFWEWARGPVDAAEVYAEDGDRYVVRSVGPVSWRPLPASSTPGSGRELYDSLGLTEEAPHAGD